MKVTVLGEGAWGTAISTLLASNGHEVKLWCHDKEVAQSIINTRINYKYFKEFKLDPKINPVTDISQALEESNWIFEAIPVKFLRSIINICSKNINPEIPWIILSKGIENETLLLPSQIIDDCLNFIPQKVILSGPSFAVDLAQKQVTAVNLASTNINLAQNLKSILDNNYFFTKIIDDPIGAQVCGALKNIIALAIGMLEGAGYTDNTKAYIITEGLKEISLINKALGGKIETTYDLAGVGDLVLTSLSNKSKNFQLGYKLGKGEKLEEILKNSSSFAEGPNTITSAIKLIKKYNLDLRLIKNIYSMVYEDKNLNNIF